MNVLFLGTGTSHGVPMIGCTCAVCRSSDPRDNRLRPSILIEDADGTRVLVDTSPDLRQQCLTHGIDRIDAIVYTHAHADHVLGFDELRRFNVMTKRPLPVFGDRGTLAQLRQTFAYAFDPDTPAGGGVPQVEVHVIEGPLTIGALSFIPLPVFHGSRPILGFRIGGFAYLTDCNAIPESSLAQLDSLDVLVLDALRHKPHPTHFSLSEAVAMAQHIGARQTYFTHMCHDLGHAPTCAVLPPGVTLAFDGLKIQV